MQGGYNDGGIGSGGVSNQIIELVSNKITKPTLREVIEVREAA